jgi:uncharacterized protein
MTAERHIDYEALAQAAMRGMVRDILVRVAKSGLPGEHHFYIAFGTAAPGVIISKRLKEKYPEEMTVVLQHRFWDLTVSEERFEVKLTFDGIPERLSVPFSAIKVFFDPSVPYGLQFEPAGVVADEGEDAGFEADSGPPTGSPIAPLSKSGARSGGGAVGRLDKKPRSTRKVRPDKPGETVEGKGSDASSEASQSKPSARDAPPAANDTKVVSLDTFRKK